MDDIKEMRSEIDAIDASIAQLYRQRMEVARRIGRFKLEHNLPVDDPQREAQLLTARTAELEPELRPGAYTRKQALSAQGNGYSPKGCRRRISLAGAVLR